MSLRHANQNVFKTVYAKRTHKILLFQLSHTRSALSEILVEESRNISSERLFLLSDLGRTSTVVWVCITSQAMAGRLTMWSTTLSLFNAQADSN